MLKDGELQVGGDDQPFVFEESPSCESQVADLSHANFDPNSSFSHTWAYAAIPAARP